MVALGNDQFESVDCYKHLGHYIRNNLEDTKDVEIRLKAFYGKTNWVFRNFAGVLKQFHFFSILIVYQNTACRYEIWKRLVEIRCLKPST